ncbi:MAG: flagellar basal body L-ring protein FlgH [Dictyoglomi bacterium]|jgi:flagellar L-ring protein precursor FlgH|nr:flagellar basal body L-ring protein FlgH [Dictyoglomota bacterium]HHV80891.1 flagellar basal body L-ring protein FlgH [bacterium]
MKGKIILLIIILTFNLGLTKSLYTDHRAFDKGDTLTVIITEYTQADQQMGSGTNKSVNLKGGPGVGFLDFVSAFFVELSSAFSGGRNTSQAARFSGNVGVVVNDVLSNGLLRIEGSKVVTVNNEEQVVYVKGLVRPEDIDKDNTVISSKVVDLDVKYQSSAPKPEGGGILSTILYWLQELLRILF